MSDNTSKRPIKRINKRIGWWLMSIPTGYRRPWMPVLRWGPWRWGAWLFNR